jgi:hypothetical protein
MEFKKRAKTMKKKTRVADVKGEEKSEKAICV